MRCRHRMGKLLLRRAIRFDGGQRAWSQRHRSWLRGLRFELAADQKVFDEYLLAIEQLEERLRGLDDAIEQLSHQRHRHDQRHDRRDRAIRVRPLHISAWADGIPGSRPQRALLLRQPPTWGDHKGWQRPCEESARRGLLALPPSPQRRDSQETP